MLATKPTIKQFLYRLGTVPVLIGSANATSGFPFSNSSSREEPTDECSKPCVEDFFCLEGAGICVPACSSWSDYPRGTDTAVDVLVILFACLGLLSAIGIMVIASIRYKHV